MSRCSKKCNEIKRRIDDISGLDSDIVYEWLERLENVTDSFVRIIENHADSSETNGTCFEQVEEIDIQSIEELGDILRMGDLECPYGKNETMMWKQAIVQQNKINELIKAVKQLNKKIK